MQFNLGQQIDYVHAPGTFKSPDLWLNTVTGLFKLIHGKIGACPCTFWKWDRHRWSSSVCWKRAINLIAKKWEIPLIRISSIKLILVGGSTFNGLMEMCRVLINDSHVYTFLFNSDYTHLSTFSSFKKAHKEWWKKVKLLNSFFCTRHNHYTLEKTTYLVNTFPC